ncbi:MAG: rhodanese-like domain-containing protein [Actinomycetota bacterium]|nr:rhodanese-like domain-containing protein [Actinomycetota bacterium]
MTKLTTLKDLDFEDALQLHDEGAAFVDLRDTDDYLEVHIPGALGLLYEGGPGMPVRARDCIPLATGLILLDFDSIDLDVAGAALKGKGFAVWGRVSDGINQWAAQGGRPSSTEVVTDMKPPPGTILDVADPGARPPKDATRVPAENMWDAAEDFAYQGRIVLAAGYGVRAALTVGMLERAGVKEIVFWKTRPAPPRL